MSWFTPNKPNNTLRSKRALSAGELCIFAMLGTLMFCSKIVMEWIPNVHLLGMLTMVYTLVYRKKALIPIYVYVMLNGIYADVYKRQQFSAVARHVTTGIKSASRSPFWLVERRVTATVKLQMLKPEPLVVLSSGSRVRFPIKKHLFMLYSASSAGCSAGAVSYTHLRPYPPGPLPASAGAVSGDLATPGRS